MGNFVFERCPIEGLYVITPAIHADERGYFFESYNEKDFELNGLTMKFVQSNQSYSKKGVLRGLHVQKNFLQGKLVRVLNGEIFDVAVDMRKGSPTFLQWHGVRLSSEIKNEFYIPEGFAHGFYVMSESAEISFMVSDFWHPNDEIGIPWNDELIGIKWPIQDVGTLIIAEKDQNYRPIEVYLKTERKK